MGVRATFDTQDWALLAGFGREVAPLYRVAGDVLARCKGAAEIDRELCRDDLDRDS
jgi:hypothetical protein